MKLRMVLFGSVAVCALAPFATAGELRGTYLAIEGGAGWVDGENLARVLQFTTGASTATAFAADFDSGFALMGTLGYAFKNGVRAELEVGYRSNDIDTLVSIGGPTTATGDLSEFSLMVNLIYDIKLGDRVTASIGAGVGADNASLEEAAFAIDEDDWVFAFQGLLGLNYAVGDRTQIFLNYRYFRADAPDFTNFVNPPPAVQRLSFADDLNKHAVTVGFRIGLQGDATPPPPAPPPPAPPPPPPPVPVVPKQFIVFFGFDRADLTPEATRVVTDAADAARRTGAAAIAIIGHTDSSGSVHYNQRLSERRANAVRSELVHLGVPAASITAGGQGESDLIVKTGDGVKEPQNRRATIDLQ